MILWVVLACDGLLVPHNAAHTQRLTTAAAQLSGSTSRVQIKRGGSNRVPSGNKSPSAARLDLAGFSSVLEVRDSSVVVEPMCTMEELVRATLVHGLLPKVVPEFKDITVGGAIMGGAMESSSHRHGMFHDTMEQAECLLSNGTVVLCSPSDRSDLFHSLGGSYGSLCIVTAVTIQCVPSRRYVELRLQRYDEVNDGLAALVAAAEADDAPTFLDGVVFARGYMLVRGSLTDEPASSAPLATAGSRPWDEWYYEWLQRLHAQHSGDDAARGPASAFASASASSAAASSTSSTSSASSAASAASAASASASTSASAAPREERYHMLLEDYLFRFDRGAFNFASSDTWMTSWRDFVHPTKLPLFLASANNPVSRGAFGWLFSTGVWQPILHGLAPPAAIASQLLLQDCFVPAGSAAAAVAAARQATSDCAPASDCPIWTWPVRGASAPLAPNGHRPGEMLVNLGIYSRCADGSAPAVVRRLEAWVTEHGGRKLLYSHNYYDDDDGDGDGDDDDANANDGEAGSSNGFWRAGGYDRKGYDALRAAYGADGLLLRLDEKVLTTVVPEEGAEPSWQLQLARYFL